MVTADAEVKDPKSIPPDLFFLLKGTLRITNPDWLSNPSHTGT